MKLVMPPVALAMMAAMLLAGAVTSTKPLQSSEPGNCPDGSPGVRCFVAPCSTQECQQKCKKALSEFQQLQCVDNYCGGCNCDCCLPETTGCKPESKDTNASCCPETICAISNACAINIAATCTTSCVQKEDAAENCLKAGQTCNPAETRCCFNLGCRQAGNSEEYKCQNCKTIGEGCASSDECCPFLACTKSDSGNLLCQISSA